MMNDDDLLSVLQQTESEQTLAQKPEQPSTSPIIIASTTRAIFFHDRIRATDITSRDRAFIISTKFRFSTKPR